MNLLERSALALGAGLAVLAFASCSGGGPNVPALYPGSPSPAASPTSSATTAATSTPTAAATSTAAATATPTSAASGVLPTTTPSAGASGTPAATATPTNAATSVAAVCPPPTPYPSPAVTTYPFQTNTGTIQLPTYQDVTGTSDIPMITGGLPASVTIKVGRTNFDNAPNPNNGTPIGYFSLILMQPSGGSGSVTFAKNMVPVHITSPCSISTAHTYNVYGYAAGTQIEAKTGLTPDSDGHTVTTTLDIPPLYGNSFPANLTVDIVATQT